MEYGAELRSQCDILWAYELFFKSICTCIPRQSIYGYPLLAHILQMVPIYPLIHVHAEYCAL